MENKELIRKWLDGELSPAEWDVLKTLPEYREYNKIVENSARFQKPDFDTERNFAQLQDRLRNTGRSKNNGKGKVRSIVIPSALKIAAVLVVLLTTGWFIYYNSPTSISTGTGEIAVYGLPDNSEVRLNAESKIKYYPRKWDGNRSLSLEGEAFFEVEKGQKFEVQTSQGIVQVLGTKFNVKNRPGFFEVTCYEGSVRVCMKAGKPSYYQMNLLKLLKIKSWQGVMLLKNSRDGQRRKAGLVLFL